MVKKARVSASKKLFPNVFRIDSSEFRKRLAECIDMVMHPQDASTKNGLLVTHYGKHSVFVISLEDAQRLHLLKRDKRYRDALKAINADMK